MKRPIAGTGITITETLYVALAYLVVFLIHKDYKYLVNGPLSVKYSRVNTYNNKFGRFIRYRYCNEFGLGWDVW